MSFFDFWNIPAQLRETLFQLYIVKREVLSMSQQMTELMDQVSAIEDAGDSAIALLHGLKEQLDEAIASNDPAKLQELSERLGAQTAELAEAIILNTPVLNEDLLEVLPEEEPPVD